MTVKVAAVQGSDQLFDFDFFPAHAGALPMPFPYWLGAMQEVWDSDADEPRTPCDSGRQIRRRWCTNPGWPGTAQPLGPPEWWQLGLPSLDAPAPVVEQDDAEEEGSMIYLTSNTRLVTVGLGGAITTNPLTAVVSFRDACDCKNRGTEATDLVDVGPTPIVSPLPFGTEWRAIEELSLTNLDSVSATVTVFYSDGSTNSVLWSGELGLGESLHYALGRWYRLDANGFEVVHN